MAACEPIPRNYRAAQESVLQLVRRFEGDERAGFEFWFNAGTRANPKPPIRLDWKDIDAGGKISYGVDNDTRRQTSTDDLRRDQGVARSHGGGDQGGVPADRSEAVHRAFAEAVRDQLADPGLLRLLAQGSPALEGLIPGAIHRPSRQRMP